jgi:hypothetical protein
MMVSPASIQPRTSVADFLFGIRIEDDKGIFDAPVGGVSDVRNAGQPVEGDVVLARVLAEIFASPCGAGR